MTTDRDRILSEFIDAWNRGDRPDVDDYVSRVPQDEQAALAEQLVTFLSFAPTPAYSDEALDAIRAEAPVAEAVAATGRRGGLLPSLLGRLRARAELSVPEMAAAVVSALGLPESRAEKTSGYLERLERGELDPGRVSRRVFGALARVLGVPRDELEGAADIGGRREAPAPVFRADGDEAAAAVGRHLEVLADALEAPGGTARDEVDNLFLGGR